ncbi:MAG: damage-inducible protein DinB [Bauldia sp.]|nr:damage-inducible protein DinB [Bauldia sp.]
MLPHFRMFAGYNRWANRRLYDAVRALPDADYRADRGAFFGSLRGTLNHILVADRIWLHRFTGEGDAPRALDAILHDAFADLEPARTAEDERIIAFVAALDEARLDATFPYSPISTPEQTIVQPLREALAHLFNHQTHHRGQAHTLLTIAGGRNAAPSLDLLLFQRSDEYRGVQ